MAVDGARDARTGHDLAAGVLLGGNRTRYTVLNESATPMRRLSASMLRTSNVAVTPAVTNPFHPSCRPVGGKREACEPFDARLEFDKRAEVGKTCDRPVRIWPTAKFVATESHGSSLNCFTPRRIFCVSSSTRAAPHRDLLACGHEPLGFRDARPAHVRNMEQPLTPPQRSTNAPKSRTETTPRPFIPRPARSPSRFISLCLPLGLEQRARDDKVLCRRSCAR